VRVWFGFHRPTARQMTHGAASMAVVALASFSAPFAAAKPLQVVIQPASDQLAGMDRGSEIVISRRDGSEVWMQIPAPDDNSRIEVKFLFVNKSDKPINVGPEIISSDLISVIPYEKLIEEQKSRETVRKVGHFFLNYVRDRSASSAGTTTATVNYSGMTSNGTIYSGTGTVSVTDPVARQQALERAAEENEIRREQMVQAFQNSRSAIAANLRTTTLMPNYHISGVMTFEIPHALRSASSSKPFTMTVQMGSDRHVLAGAAGPFGTLPAISPSAELVAFLAQRTAPIAPVAKSIPATYVPGPTQTVLASNQPGGTSGAKVQLASAEAPAKPKPKTSQKPVRARRDDWGLVAVPSQVGY